MIKARTRLGRLIARVALLCMQHQHLPALPAAQQALRPPSNNSMRRTSTGSVALVPAKSTQSSTSRPQRVVPMAQRYRMGPPKLVSSAVKGWRGGGHVGQQNGWVSETGGSANGHHNRLWA